MDIDVEIIALSQVSKEKIDYDRLIFKIKLPKKIDIENSREHQIFLQTLIDGGVKKILVNFHDVDFIDSSAIGVFISMAKSLRQRSGDLVLAEVSTDIKTIFKVINLQDFIKIFNTAGEALNHFHTLKV